MTQHAESRPRTGWATERVYDPMYFVISWPISVIVEARSQLEHATKDKLEGDGGAISR